MSVEYGFYNSVNGDRKYSARAFARIFNGVINDGIYGAVGDKFMVTPNTNDSAKLSVIVGTGQAWFLSTWTLNNSAFSIDLQAANLAYTRIDAIVLKVDTAERTNSIIVKIGTPAPEPTRPSLTKNQSLGEYALAYVTIPAGATKITAANIQNVMGGETPLVTGVNEVLSAKEVFSSWEAQVAQMQSSYKNSFDNLYNTYGNSDGKFPTLESAYKTIFNNIENTYANPSTGKFPILEKEYTTKFSNALSEFNTSADACISAFNSDQNSRKTAFNQEQTERASVFEVSEASRSNNFEKSESGRATSFNDSQSDKSTRFEEAMTNWDKRVSDLVGGKFPEGSVLTSTIVDGAVTKAKLGNDVLYAGSSEKGGMANSAAKLNTDAGASTRPVFFINGVPKAIEYTIETSVPPNAKFTDTQYSLKSFGIGVTPQEINFLSGVTSGIQGQLNDKANNTSLRSYLALTGGDLSGAIGLNGVYLTNGVDYGTELPGSAPAGKLFFKKI